MPSFVPMVEGDRTYVELPTWHWLMLSQPAELAKVLGSVSR